MILLTGCNCHTPIINQIDLEKCSSDEEVVEILSSRITEKTNKLFNRQLKCLIRHIRETGCEYTLNQVRSLTDEDFHDFDLGCRIFREQEPNDIDLKNQDGCYSFNLTTRLLSDQESIDYFNINNKNTKIQEIIHLSVLMRSEEGFKLAYPLIKQLIFKENPLSLNRAYLIYLIGQGIQFTFHNMPLAFVFYRELSFYGHEAKYFLNKRFFFPRPQFFSRFLEKCWVYKLKNYIGDSTDNSIFFLLRNAIT